MPDLLQLENVEARYGPVKALHGVSLAVAEGEIVAGLGAYVRRDRKAVREDEARVLAYFPWLAERRDQQAGTLSGGEQQMLALARALMLRPRLVLLDEPSLGLAPKVVAEIFRIVRELNERQGLTVLVVEQNAALALEAASRAYVLEVGRVALEGGSETLR